MIVTCYILENPADISLIIWSPAITDHLHRYCMFMTFANADANASVLGCESERECKCSAKALIIILITTYINKKYYKKFVESLVKLYRNIN